MTTPRSRYLLAVAVALGTIAFLLFGIGALGIIGAGGRPDLMYLGAVGVGLVGVGVARFRPAGMALALGATALSTLTVGVIAIGAGLSEREGASVIEILGLSGMYAVMFGASALLFRSVGRTAPGRA